MVAVAIKPHGYVFPVVQFELVTPTQAEQWLAAMDANRRIRPRIVKRYARAMLRGQWAEDNPDSPIMLSTDGKLLNGQHRLRALVITGKSLYLPVATGVRPAVMRTADMGVKRTAGDVLTISGREQGDALAAAAGWLLRYENSVREGVALANQVDVTEIDIEEAVNAHPGLLEAAGLAQHLMTVGIYPSAARWLAYEFSAIDTQRASEFLSLVGGGTEANATLKALHKYLLTQLARGRRGGDPQWLRVIFVVKAWNAWFAGRPLVYFRLGKKEATPQILGRSA